MCNLTRKSYPLLAGAIDFFYTNRANATGETINEISESNLLSFYDATNIISVFHDFINQSIKPFVHNRAPDKEV